MPKFSALWPSSRGKNLLTRNFVTLVIVEKSASFSVVMRERQTDRQTDRHREKGGENETQRERKGERGWGEGGEKEKKKKK